jgi:hypothetical protein
LFVGQKHIFAKQKLGSDQNRSDIAADLERHEDAVEVLPPQLFLPPDVHESTLAI